MKKQTITLLTLTALLFFIAACGKDKDDTPAKTKTQYITQSTWKFDKATANGNDVSNLPMFTCWKDNIVTFASTTEGSGTGTIDEGANVCSPSSAGAFTWSFQTNETILFMSTPVIPTGSSNFLIVTLNGTNLVVSQDVNVPPFGMQNVVVTFKH